MRRFAADSSPVPDQGHLLRRRPYRVGARIRYVPIKLSIYYLMFLF